LKKSKSLIDKGRRAAERFVPCSYFNLTRDDLIDYCAVMWARGYAAGKRASPRRNVHCEHDITLVRLTKDIFDDGEDHHPPGYLGRVGDTVEVRSLVTIGVAHVGYVGPGQFIVRAGEFEALPPPTKCDGQSCEHCEPEHGCKPTKEGER
jgi:hypothetical protein